MAALDLPAKGDTSQRKEEESGGAKNLPWLWIVDYLSRIPQISNSLLCGLIESSPAPIEDIGATEAMALRCLEELIGYSPSSTKTAESPSEAGSSDQVDMHTPCIDTLEKFVRMKIISNIERKKFVHMRSNFLPYLRSKRASLPKSHLQRMRDAFHITDSEESNPLTTENDQKATTSCFEAINEDDPVHPEENEQEENEKENEFPPSLNEEQAFEEPREVECDSLKSEDRSCEDDGYLFEKVDVSMEKERFLSSCADEFDPDKPSFCTICKEDGELLVCSSIGCPLMVHETCLPSSPEYYNGSFYCPFCACSMVFSELHSVHQKARLAWKDLRRFKRAVASPIKRHVIPPDDQSLPKDDERVINSGNDNPSSRKRRRKSRQKLVSPTIPQLKRKRIPWTAEEEDALREGVKKYAVSGDSIPWTVILEHGSSVFGKKRNTIDLKDKWRNICKKSNKSA